MDNRWPGQKNDHLMTHPEGKGKVIVIRILLSLLGVLLLVLLFNLFFPNFNIGNLRPEASSETKISDSSQSNRDSTENSQSKRSETYNKDADYKWDPEDFQGLKMGKISSEEVLETFGKPYLVRRWDDEVTFVYQDQPEHNHSNPQETVILGFGEKDGDFILKAKSSKNLTRPFENNKTEETPSVWTKQAYQELPVSNEAEGKNGITYEELQAQYGLPYDILVWDEQTLNSSRQTLRVRYFHETKYGDETLEDYVSVNLVFEQATDGGYYLVDKSALAYD